MSHPVTPDLCATRIAEGQHGLITRAQARSTGLTDDQIDWRVRTGRWRRIAPAVYAVAGSPRSWRQDALAACLAGPAGTAASFLTAAALHGLWTPPPLPHVTAPRGTSARLRIARVHRGDLDPLDRCRIDGIPATGPARTLVDAAMLVAREPLADLVDDALCRHLTAAPAVLAAAARAQHGPGRRGIPLLREVLEAWHAGIQPGSPAEMRLLRLLEQSGFGTPVKQLRVYARDGTFIGRLDLAYPEWFGGLEYDGERFHNPRHWARDEARYAAFRAAGWSVESVAKHDLLGGARDLLERLRKSRARRAAA
jgi:hypothetical protein